MSIRGVLLKPSVSACPHIPGNTAINDNLLVMDMDDQDLENLLSNGFRHFGELFFRPYCLHCRSCIHLRIPVRDFVPSKAVRRLYNRSRHLTVTLESPTPSQEFFDLYVKHKERFKTSFEEGYDEYLNSFYFPYHFNRMLVIRDGKKTVAVSHVDVTANAMSAVYCYFDDAYARFSPGKLAVYKEIELAAEFGCQWLYIGFYIGRNPHTRYKIDFKPLEFMVEGEDWQVYTDASGKIVNPMPVISPISPGPVLDAPPAD
ncbi:MAG: GNAT family N-acetyltransferase [bacterium]|nr:GNAT family N-acetyltransferase [bacterium]